MLENGREHGWEEVLSQIEEMLDCAVLPSGVSLHLEASAFEDATVAVVREERWIDSRGELQVSDRVYLTDSPILGRCVSFEAYLDQDGEDGSRHCAEVLREVVVHDVEEAAEVVDWACGLVSSDEMERAAARRKVARALSETFDAADLPGEDPRMDAESTWPDGFAPMVWVEEGRVWASLAPKIAGEDPQLDSRPLRPEEAAAIKAPVS